ncbi:immunoglobulin-like domain-containing protein [Enterococcus sp. BWR-S5]|uniref:immunoglobulin-like domain-containing protein n=1 Tax=Enterococcus sp. BWR-S5 TaxID=2787714 RepID=UPI001922CF64|nr:immunoglobulin-like domain-containing protein [Enterococcus sp. BWR-S5]MBL1227154.1 leucine-rich repeat domain-containing protein [Enterococcus sp. BWR-S5]
MKKKFVGLLFSTLCLSMAVAPMATFAEGSIADELMVPRALLSQNYSLLTPDSYRLGVDDFITGLSDTTIKKVALYVNGSFVRNGVVYSDGSFEVEASDAVTSVNDDVEIVGMDRRNNELERQKVSIEQENILLSAEEYTLFDNEIRGVAGNNMGVVSLLVNGDLMRSAAVNNDGSYTLPVESGDIIELEDHVEVVGSLFGKELARIVIPVNAIDLSAAINTFASGVDNSVTGTVSGKGLAKAKTARLFVNRRRTSEVAIDGNGGFSLATERLSLTFKDDVKVAILTEDGEELGRYQVNIAQEISDIFPDTEFARYMAMMLNRYENGNTMVTKADLTEITDLSLIDKNWVFDLTGIEYLTGLTTLYLGNFHGDRGDGTSMSIDFDLLKNLTNLESLTIHGSGDLQNLSWIKNLTNLTYLDLRSNPQFSDIQGVEYLTNLEHLNLSDNGLENISLLAGLTNLEFLDLSQNSFEDVSPLAGLVNLRELRIWETPVTNMDSLSHLTELEIRN